MKLEGAKVIVVGMARSGVAAAQLLLEKGAHVRAVDQNPKPIPELALTIEPQTESAFLDADHRSDKYRLIVKIGKNESL